MSTWEQWVDEVQLAYGGEMTQTQLKTAVKDGARAVMARDVESDLALAKSYRDSFKEARFDLAAARIDDINAFVAEVLPLMPVDDDTSAMADALENAIRSACDTINGDANKFEKLVAEAAIEMQRHIPFFQARHENVYLKDGDGVTNEAFVSKTAPPDGFRLTQMWFGKYYPDLEEEVAYEADDFVVSNNRVYKVITGGTLTEGQLGDGLTSTDGEDEELGDLVFQYYSPLVLIPARAYPWIDRARLRAGRMSAGPVYALSDQFDELWLYPPLDDDHRFVMEWVGIKQSWEDDDEVTFDSKAAACAAHYVRSFLQREILGDSRKSAEEFALFQRDLRGLVIDCEQREQGMSARVAAYQYWNTAPCGACSIVTQNSNNGTEVNPNAWAQVINTGGDSTLTPTAANMTFDIDLTGAAGLRRLVLATHGMTPGWRVTLRFTFPATEGIIVDLRNGSLGGAQLFPAERFPDLTYTTDGVTTTAMVELHFGNNTWVYDEASIPA